MTEEQAIERIKEFNIPQGDEEIMHTLADEVLTDFLIEAGYEKLVNEYSKVPKWYA